MMLSIKELALASVCSTAGILAAFAAAATEPTLAESVPAGIQREVVLTGSGFRVGVDTFTIGPKADPSRQALLRGIATWLSGEFGLPETEELPTVTYASARRMKGLRFRDVPTDRWNDEQHDIVAVYDDDARTIYLPDGWMGRSAADLSVLVHEMVHHLQNLGGQKFACAEERERVAYEAQDRWLGLFGGDLEKDFEIDPFTILVRTRCFY
ncbi:DUF6647 family protein [Chelativorans alearense]|uniref:DUF6647 family protein n=1 Tax=Chelativorans alearense TaxID=2681495 RepID=UPI001FEC7F0E|nr:DUF6647 family protein [Chelativorans alearense]